MKAFAYYTAKGEPRVGLQVDGKNYNFTYIWQIFKELKNSPRTPDYYFIQMIIEMENFSKESFVEVMDEVKKLRRLEDLEIRENFTYDVPVSRPGKIICLGRNYLKHAKELNNDLPENPMIFAKLPSTLLAHEGLVKIPANVGQVDYEVELGVVIGKEAHRVRKNEALEYVAGYTIVNDITARELQKSEAAKGHPWTLAKGMDTFCPMGPFLVPADAIADPHNLELELVQNRTLKQSGNTSQMIFKIPDIISYITQFITLQAGDIICTGTPAGVGPIQAGDVLEARIDQLGTLTNSVVNS